MKKALNEGDIDKIRELITPYHLTKCSKNSLEKSLEVCVAQYSPASGASFTLLPTDLVKGGFNLLAA
jgi:hypothetical protein